MCTLHKDRLIVVIMLLVFRAISKELFEFKSTVLLFCTTSKNKDFLPEIGPKHLSKWVIQVKAVCLQVRTNFYPNFKVPNMAAKQASGWLFVAEWFDPLPQMKKLFLLKYFVFMSFSRLIPCQNDTLLKMISQISE